MTGVRFACPECGEAVRISDGSVGREVECASCGASVEVPYLPRGNELARRKGTRRSVPPMLRVAWGVVGLLAIITAVGGVNRFIRVSRISERGRRVVALTTSAREHEAAGRIDAALIDAEAAATLMRSAANPDPDRLREVSSLRDRLATTDLTRRLEALDRLEPRRAMGEALTLQAIAERDPHLNGYLAAVSAAVERSRLREIDRALDAARRGFASDHPADALAELESADAVARKLSDAGRPAAESRIRAEAERLVAVHGIGIEPFSGKTIQGAISDYDSAYRSMLIDQARERGYLTRPAKSPFRDLWERPPARLGLSVQESYAGSYLDSKSRVTEIHGDLTLSRGDRVVWRSNPNGRTRVPVEGLPAYLASRLAISRDRDAEAEERLHADAFASFGEQLGIKIRGLPPPERPR